MSETFQKIGCIIGKDYSKPVVDIKLSALKAKKIFTALNHCKSKANVSRRISIARKQEKKKMTFDVIIGAGLSGTFMSSS